MFSYKPGGFLPGKPVQPVLIKYKVSIYLNRYLNFKPPLKVCHATYSMKGLEP